MREIKQILFPTDLSPGNETIIRHALTFAELYGAVVHIFHATLLYEDEDLENADGRTESEVAAMARMKKLAEGHANVSVVPVQGCGETVTASIMGYIRRHPIDMVIMGTHGHGGFKRWFLGSIAEEIVHLAPCPVLTLKETWKPEQKWDIKSILVPIDFSLASQTAVRYGKELAAKCGASIQLLHVIQQSPNPEVYGTPAYMLQDFYKGAEQKAVGIIKRLLEEPGPNVPADYCIICGHPGREVLKHAKEQNCDLILMAHLGMTRLPDRMFGSITEHVVRTSACPVLTADMG